MTNLALLAELTKTGEVYDLNPPDIKAHYPEKSGGQYTPVILVNGNLTTIRSFSNIIFGQNMRTVHSNSCNQLFSNHSLFYEDTMPWVGQYNQKSHGGNGYNSGSPFFGEHTYSGTNIFNGYFRE
jgi:hypothetical protein